MIKKQYLMLFILITVKHAVAMSDQEKQLNKARIYALSAAIEKCQERLARARSCDKPAEHRYIRGDLVKKSDESYTPTQYYNQCTKLCDRRFDTCDNDRSYCRSAASRNQKPRCCEDAKRCELKGFQCVFKCYKAFRNDIKEARNQCSSPESADDIAKIETECKRLVEEWNNIPYDQRSETFSWKGSDYSRNK